MPNDKEEKKEPGSQEPGGRTPGSQASGPDTSGSQRTGSAVPGSGGPGGKEDSGFIRQRTKPKPLSKRRALFYVIVAFAAGIAFALGVFLVDQLIIPYFNRPAAESADAQQENATEEEPATEEETQQPDVVVEEKDLQLSDYQALKDQLYQIGQDMDAAIVTVSGTTQGTDPFGSDYENTDQAMGLVIQNDGENLLVLTQSEALSNAQDIQITFQNGEEQKAQLVGSDGNIGLGIVSVPLNRLSDSLKDNRKVATLDTTGSVEQGDVVVAVGSPLGSIYSILDGTITSVTNDISIDDAVYSIYTTDMAGSTEGSGVLLDLEGNVIGILWMEYDTDTGSNTLAAISMREIYPLIQKLEKGEQVAYLGLNVSTLDYETAQKNNMPQGVYVRQVEEDSPAMGAGLQAGDVITAIGDTDIQTVNQYMECLLSKKPDQDDTIVVQRADGSGGYAQVSLDITYGSK